MRQGWMEEGGISGTDTRANHDNNFIVNEVAPTNLEVELHAER